MSGWGNEDESTSSSSTISSSKSRRRENAIDVLSVRDKIVKQIMDRKRREEERNKGKEASSSSNLRRPSRVPLANLPPDDDQMDITPQPSASRNGRENRNVSFAASPQRDSALKEKKQDSETSTRSSRSRAPVYSSTPLTGRFTPASDDERSNSNVRTGYPAHRVRSPTKSQKPTPTMIPEVEVEEEAGAIEQEEEEEAAPEPQPTTSSGRSRVKSPQKTGGKEPPRKGRRVAKDSAAEAEASSQREASRTSERSKKTPSKKNLPEPKTATPARQEPSETRSRRKVGRTPMRKSSPDTRLRKMFAEVRKLQNEPGFLIPRLPFMRVVREVATQVAINGSDYRFTVDAMEAIQTATEFYLTNVFSDAAKLAQHAKRATIMPKDLDLLRTLRIVDT